MSLKSSLSYLLSSDLCQSPTIPNYDTLKQNFPFSLLNTDTCFWEMHMCLINIFLFPVAYRSLDHTLSTVRDSYQ